ncbi:MAG: hypothetical protein U0531_10610 [Dehalococcoidia bacterium]
MISPHNEYLQLLADTGLLGALLFYGVVALALREGWWLWRVSRQPLHGALGLGFIAVVVVVVVGGLTANPLTTQPAVALYFWVLLALVAARRCESATAAPAGSRLVDGLKTGRSRMNPEPFRISEDYLFAVIGRLHVENLVLRERLAEMERATSQR